MREPDESRTDESGTHESTAGATDESVPAGGAGADSGAVDAVGITRGDTADVQNIASVNDIPGVGTRGGDGRMASADARHAARERRRHPEPGWSSPDEDPGAAHHTQRVVHRDAGEDAGPPEGGRRHTPRLAQNAPTVEEELDGIVTQTRADLGAVPRSRARSVLAQRLADAGIRLTEDEVETLVERVTAPGGPAGR